MARTPIGASSRSWGRADHPTSASDAGRRPISNQTCVSPGALARHAPAVAQALDEEEPSAAGARGVQRLDHRHGGRAAVDDHDAHGIEPDDELEHDLAGRAGVGVQQAVGDELAHEQDRVLGALGAELAVEVLGDLVPRAPGRARCRPRARPATSSRVAAVRGADHRRGTEPGRRLVERRTGLAALAPATLAPFSPPSSVRAAQMERRETVRTRPLGPRSSVMPSGSPT